MGSTAPLSGGDNGAGGVDRPRRLLLLASVLAALVIAIVVFALAQGGDEVSLNPIAQAAVRTEESPGARALLRATAQKSGSGLIEMSGQGAYNGRTGRSEMTITAHGPNSDMTLHAVASRTHMYFKSKAFQSELPGDAEWMGLDLGQDTPSDAALSSNSDPSSQLDLLKSVSDEFETLGKDTIRGVKTTGYRSTLDTGLEVETWIDGKGLVRRARIKGSPSDPTSVDMTVDFYDFGISPDIKLPDPDTVFDATNLAGLEAGE